MILAAIVLFLLAVVGKVFQEARFEAAAELLLPLSVACCAFCLFDRKTAASLASVSALLLFSVAIWDTLSIPLRDLTVLITSSVVSLAGWPALITGADIILPDGTVRIEEGCSGLKYFVAASCLGYFSAIINNLNSLKTFVVVLVFIAAALLGNWLRVTLLVAVAHYTELQSPLLESHNSFGWVLFGVLLIPTILICDRINGTGDKGPESTSG
jgi:exosortase